MGFWIRPQGGWYHIPDHWNFMRGKPKIFGFSLREAASWTLKDRDAVMAEAKRAGWIRVRGTSPHLSIEFWKLNGDTIANIKDFLQSEQVNPDEKIMFEEEIRNGKTWYEPASWILDDDALKYSRNPKRRR